MPLLVAVGWQLAAVEAAFAVDPPLLTLGWLAEPDVSHATFGDSVSSAGDVNGDGYDDVIVGAPSHDNGPGSTGKVFVYLGSNAGLERAASWTAAADQMAADFGASVSAAGDVNGDGFDDVIVGARFYDGGSTDEGRALLYLGGATGLEPAASWTVEGDQDEAHLGGSVSEAGDVNGDGYDDVIVGAGWYDGVFTNAGTAHVYLGSSTGLDPAPAWVGQGDQSGAEYGESVSDAGDVNGDGYDDVIVGSHDFNAPLYDAGKVFVYLGSPTGLEPAASWTAIPTEDFVHFGGAVSSAGDVNGDGFGDVVVGAEEYPEDDLFDSGLAFVYLGSASGLEAGPATVLSAGAQADALFGHAVSAAGDVNADGFGDVLVGAPNRDHLAGEEGLVSLYLGSPDGLEPTAAWTAESGQTQAFLGTSAAQAGDVNGDGRGDILAGAPGYDNLFTDQGRASVYMGLCIDSVPDLDADGLADACDPCSGDNTSGDGDVDGFCASAADGSSGDCDDTDPNVHPGAVETCNGVDDDCDDLLPGDEMDLDADGVPTCGGDCDDDDASVGPGVPELCDGRDNTCSGAVPSNEEDLDGDGSLPCGGDCDDLDGSVHPDAAEVCNARDDNCDTQIPADEGDLDQDGALRCADCDDLDRTAHPGAEEYCGDHADDDCDGLIDETCPRQEGCGCAATPGPRSLGLLVAFVLTPIAARRRHTANSATSAAHGAAGAP